MTEEKKGLTQLFGQQEIERISAKDLAMIFNISYEESPENCLEYVAIGKGTILFQYPDNAQIFLGCHQNDNDNDWLIDHIGDVHREKEAREAKLSFRSSGVPPFIEVITRDNQFASHDLTLMVYNVKFYEQGMLQMQRRKRISDLDFISALLHAKLNEMGQLQIFENVS